MAKQKVKHLYLGWTLLIAASVTMVTACPGMCTCNADTVTCSNKDLTSVPSGIQDNTRTLYLTFNNIQMVQNGSFPSLPDLTHLFMYNNDIESIEVGAFDQMPNLQYLGLEQNKISLIPKGLFDSLWNLEALSLAGNDISHLENGTFQNLVKVHTLELRSNKLATLTPDMFQGLDNLQFLELKGNQITYLPQGLFKLFPQLSKIDLSKNPIPAIEENVISGLPGLGDLVLSDIPAFRTGRIPTDLFTGLFNLTRLDLSANQLTKLPDGLKHLSNLEFLNLGDNNLTNIPDDAFEQTTNITHLYLYYNHLKTIPANAISKLTSLHTLDLAYSSITEIPTNSFVNFPKLEVLWISQCKTAVIHSGAFDGLLGLKGLDLRDNILATLPWGVFDDFPNDTDIHLEDNPWQCDCRLDWLAGETKVKDNPKCQTPPLLQAQTIKSLSAGDFQCTLPEISQNVTNLSGNSGDSVHLPCNATGFPTPQYTWYFQDGSVIEPSSQYQIQPDGSLLLANPTVQDTGSYTCRVSNPAGNASTTIFLDIVHLSMMTTTSLSGMKDTAPSSTANGKFTTFSAANMNDTLPPVGAATEPENSPWMLIVFITAAAVIVLFVIFLLMYIMCRRRTRQKSGAEHKDQETPGFEAISTLSKVNDNTTEEHLNNYTGSDSFGRDLPLLPTENGIIAQTSISDEVDNGCFLDDHTYSELRGNPEKNDHTYDTLKSDGRGSIYEEPVKVEGDTENSDSARGDKPSDTCMPGGKSEDTLQNVSSDYVPMKPVVDNTPTDRDMDKHQGQMNIQHSNATPLSEHGFPDATQNNKTADQVIQSLDDTAPKQNVDSHAIITGTESTLDNHGVNGTAMLNDGLTGPSAFETGSGVSDSVKQHDGNKSVQQVQGAVDDKRFIKNHDNQKTNQNGHTAMEGTANKEIRDDRLSKLRNSLSSLSLDDLQLNSENGEYTIKVGNDLYTLVPRAAKTNKELEQQDDLKNPDSTATDKQNLTQKPSSRDEESGKRTKTAPSTGNFETVGASQQKELGEDVAPPKVMTNDDGSVFMQMGDGALYEMLPVYTAGDGIKQAAIVVQNI
ncbi:uncharacterized protein [Ptychodera flava]|uniref:uncharacterized protein n=1 Tax=Ptychodera flava TaxID=63121 RepID=UPI003969F731